MSASALYRKDMNHTPSNNPRLLRRSLPRITGLLTGALLVAHFADALGWLVRSWQDATYESWGFLALLLVVPMLVKLPARRDRVSSAHLWGAAACVAVDLLAAPLRLNVLSAVLALVSLHLWAFAHLRFAGRWTAQPHLWLALLSLPAVYWANVLVGYPLQHAVTTLATGALRLYGVSVAAEGTLLHLSGGSVMAVDQTCSGLKLLYSGVLLAVLLTPSLRGAARKVGFWVVHLGLLLSANLFRVVCLTVAQLHLGQPVSDTVHQGIGLAAFALCCAASLCYFRALTRANADENHVKSSICMGSHCAEVSR